MIYKTIRKYTYRYKRQNYIVGNRILFLKNGTYTTRCDGTAIYARDLEDYTKQYQKELANTPYLTNMISVSCQEPSTFLETSPPSDPMTEYIIQANKVQITNHKIPTTHRQAMLSPDSLEWKKAEEAEIQSMQQFKVFTPMVLPPNRTAIETKWVYVIKYKNGQIHKYKARLVAKGYEQVHGVDYDETYAPVAKLTSLRLVLAISALLGFDVHQMDVETAFLNADLKEEVYITIPEGIQRTDGCNCFRLNKALYGLKQSPREWYNNINAILQSFGFKRLLTEHCLYFYNRHNQICIISLYVDDLVIAGSCDQIITDVKSRLSQRYKMKDLGHIDEILGCKVKVDRTLETITINQHKYLDTIISKFDPADLKMSNTPADFKLVLSKAHCPTYQETTTMRSVPYREAVGSLLWLSLGTRPDIAYAVSQVAKFNSNPGLTHWKAVQRIFQYLYKTRDLGLQYSRHSVSDPHSITTAISPRYPSINTTDALKPTGYVDSDYARDIDTRRSVTGYIFLLAGAPISWQSRQQPSVALSSMESEYMAACAAAQEAVWLIQLLKEFTCTFFHPVILFEDNKACLEFVKNNNNAKRSKHIDVRYHFISDLERDKVITLTSVRSQDNIADIMTKPLDKTTFARLSSKFMRVIN